MSKEDLKRLTYLFYFHLTVEGKKYIPDIGKRSYKHTINISNCCCTTEIYFAPFLTSICEGCATQGPYQIPVDISDVGHRIY